MTEEDEIEHYGDDKIASKNAKIPKWLIWTYCILPFWGLLWAYLFWNGSWGWFDRGHWHQLQKGANTTFPSQNLNNPQDR